MDAFSADYSLGKPPAIALFATNARYKREAYRGSEFAPRILADNGLNVVMKARCSDMLADPPTYIIS